MCRCASRAVRGLPAKSVNTEDTDTDGEHGSTLIHGEITDVILRGAYRVHSRLGPGLLERPYLICLCHELKVLGLAHVSEKILPVEYDGLTIELGYRIDILVEDAVIVEIKSFGGILPIHEAQLLTYLRLARKRVGLLINFNVEQLKDGIRRKVNGY
jgi:GxxExxY protein